MVHQSVLRAGVTMMLRMGAVTATYMIIAITGIRAAPRTAEALKVPVVPQLQRIAMLLRAQRAVVRLQTARKHIQPAVVPQRRIKALWIPMMMATMQFMKMMITTGNATGAMMTMLPAWMMPWKMRIGKNEYWRIRQMNELVKKIMEKNRKSIDENFRIIMEDKLPTAELIKLEFESIRSLIDYSEKLALEGESAIETLE